MKAALLYFDSVILKQLTAQMKKFVLLFVSVCCAVVMSQAAMIWKPGYVVTNAGDTVKGEVKVNDKKEFDLFRKVTLKLSETEKKMYNPTKIKEYTVDGQRFIAKSIDGENVFVKVVAQGAVTLYQHQFEYYHGEEVRYDTEYYIEKNNDLSKIKGNKFKKIVAEIMADNAELVKKVQESDGKYEGDAIVEVVNEYNTWFKEQNKG